MNTSSRYFVGIALTESVKDTLHDLTGAGIFGVLWVPKGNYHITLRYLGPETKINPQEIDKLLQKINPLSPFEIQFRGVGRFGSNVLWAGVEKSPELSNLKKLVDEVVDDLPDVHKDFVEYNPHMTLARMKGHLDEGAVGQFISTHQDFTLPPITVSEFVLFKNETIDGKGVITKGYKFYPLAT